MLTDSIDLLKTYLNECVFIRLKSGEEFHGCLYGFDEYHNVVIDVKKNLKFIRGENITFIAQHIETY